MGRERGPRRGGKRAAVAMCAALTAAAPIAPSPAVAVPFQISIPTWQFPEIALLPPQLQTVALNPQTPEIARRIIIGIAQIASALTRIVGLTSPWFEGDAGGPDEGVLEAYEKNIVVNRINQARVGVGMAPVEADGFIEIGADEWATTIAARHGEGNLHDAGAPFATSMGEVIWGGKAVAIRQVPEAVDQWLASAGNREAVLWPTHRAVGVGIGHVEDYLYVVVRFADGPSL